MIVYQSVPNILTNLTSDWKAWPDTVKIVKLRKLTIPIEPARRRPLYPLANWNVTGLFTRGVFLNFFLPQPIIHIATIS
jgi:hypothetical protein